MKHIIHVGNPLNPLWLPPPPSINTIDAVFDLGTFDDYPALHAGKIVCSTCVFGLNINPTNAGKPIWWSPFYGQSYCEQHIDEHSKRIFRFDWIEIRYVQFLAATHIIL